MSEWDKFYKSGKIADYLTYCSLKPKDVKGEKESADND